ncbi:rCG41253, partial [Rattus norvegicus]
MTSVIKLICFLLVKYCDYCDL